MSPNTETIIEATGDLIVIANKLTTNVIVAAIASSVDVKLSSPAEAKFIKKPSIEVTYEKLFFPPLISKNGAPPSIL